MLRVKTGLFHGAIGAKEVEVTLPKLGRGVPGMAIYPK
jgi:hypothetical protein